MKCLLNSLTVSETVLLSVKTDAVSVFRVLDMLIIYLIPFHVLNKFNLFSQH